MRQDGTIRGGNREATGSRAAGNDTLRKVASSVIFKQCSRATHGAREHVGEQVSQNLQVTAARRAGGRPESLSVALLSSEIWMVGVVDRRGRRCRVWKHMRKSSSSYPFLTPGSSQRVVSRGFEAAGRRRNVSISSPMHSSRPTYEYCGSCHTQGQPTGVC